MQLVDNILNFFVSSAYADTSASPPSTGGGLSMLVMIGVFFVFLYFVTWRPQNKRAKEHRNLLNSLAKGDEIITAGGLLGRISKISDNYVVLALTDNVEITIQKNSIVSALPKGTLKSIV